MNVLLVDDHKELRNAARELLEILGHQVTAAASGEEALERASVPDLDLLVTDLLMPGIDGVELTDRLLADQPELAVLLVSSETEDPRLRRRVDRGDVAFLAKPFSAATLRAGIDAAIAGQAVRRSDVAETSNPGREAPRHPAPQAQPAPPEPRPEDRRGTGARVQALTSATMVALVVAATILVLEPGPPELPAPPATATVRGTEIELLEPVGPLAALPAAFSWRPVAAAAAYRLTVRAVDDSILWQSDVALADGTAEPRLELAAELADRLLPAVAYTWDVAALNDAGNRIAWSGRIRFRIIPRADGAAIGAS